MFQDFLNNHIHIYGALIILGALGLAWIIHTVVNVIASRKNNSEIPVHSAAVLKRLSWPMGLMVVGVAADEAVGIAGLTNSWWADELVSALQSLPVIAWSWGVISVSRYYFNQSIDRHKDDEGKMNILLLINSLITVFLFLGGCLVLLKIWSVNITPILASAGLLTAVGALASKHSLANFFGGISIILDRPYYLGDYILLESGERGEVVHIGMRSTRLLTRDDILVTVPNSVMAESKIMNETRQVPYFRVHCRVGVAYDSDPRAVEKTLLDSLEGNPNTLAQPAPRVRFRAFGESSLEVELLAWIKDPRKRGQTIDLMIRSSLQALRRAGIEIPFPQREVAFKEKSIKEDIAA